MVNKKDELPSLDALDDRIRQVRHASEEAPTAPPASSGKALAMRSGSEMIAGVAVGGFIGYHLDGWLGTTPWLFILCLLLGFAGGVMNIYRAVSKDAGWDDKVSKLAEGGTSPTPAEKGKNAGE